MQGRGDKVAIKSKAADYAQTVEEILSPIAAENKVRIYDVEYVKEGGEYFLRCYIDRDGGVTIDDCENVSRALSDALDRSDPIPDAYTLEVSSPGLGRILTKDRHLSASIGEEVEIKLYKPLEGMKEKEFTGVLKSFDGGTVTIEETGKKSIRAGKTNPAGNTAGKKENREEGAASKAPELTIPRKDIALIRLTVNF